MTFAGLAVWRFLFLILLAYSATFASAVQHRFFVGSYGTPIIHGLTFDDKLNTITINTNNTTQSENPYLALSYDARTLYSSGLSGWSSFPVTSPGSIGNETSVRAEGFCNTWNGMFIMASKRSPYSVYGSLNCANEMVVRADGQLQNATEVSYASSTTLSSSKATIPYVRIFGMAMDPTYRYVYSADYTSGKIWTHSINEDGGLNVVGSIDAPSGVCAPRSLVVHPSGKMLYVVLEAWNVIATYSIDPSTRLPIYTGALWNLIPPDAVPGNYGSISATLSRKGSTLYATANSHVANSPGYITAFHVSEAGYIESQVFQAKTATSGGRGNNIAAAPWSENVVALSESQNGSVTLMKWVAGTPVAGPGSGSTTATAAKTAGTLKTLARVAIKDGRYEGSGCCGAVVWVD